MGITLFQQDNFSQSAIGYLPVNLREREKEFRGALDWYFGNYKIISVAQLDGAEINSNNFKIEIEVDGCRQVILLRRFKSLQAKELIDFYLGLLVELKNSGALVSQLVKTKKGELFKETVDGPQAVFQFINSNHFKANLKSFAAVARAIGGIHRVFNCLSADFTQKIDELNSLNSAVYFNKIKSYTPADFKKIEVIIQERGRQSEEEELFLAELPFIKNLIKEVKDRLADLEPLPRQIIHSDLHPHNVLMVKDEVAAIIDFDAVRISQQARDAAFALYRFGRQFFVSAPRTENEIKRCARQLKDVFLEDYLKINFFSEKELKSMPILLKDEFLVKLLFVLRSVYEEKNKTWAKDLNKFMMALREIDYFWPAD